MLQDEAAAEEAIEVDEVEGEGDEAGVEEINPSSFSFNASILYSAFIPSP